MHPIFERFERWEGIPRPGCQVNWIGAHSSTKYVAEHEPTPQGVVSPDYPPAGEDLFEWIDVLESVDRAEDQFTMVELGAGYGRWLVNAALASQQRSLPVTLVGVEAEPTRFAWIREHFVENGLDPREHRLVHAAMGAAGGHSLFQSGRADAYYGHRTVRRARNLGWALLGGRFKVVRTLSLEALLDGIDHVDLLDLDIEGSEADVIEAGGSAVDRISCIHIGTHGSEIEERLRSFFDRLRWESIWDFPYGRTIATPFGEVWFENGIQTWRNPRSSSAGSSRRPG